MICEKQSEFISKITSDDGNIKYICNGCGKSASKPGLLSGHIYWCEKLYSKEELEEKHKKFSEMRSKVQKEVASKRTEEEKEKIYNKRANTIKNWDENKKKEYSLKLKNNAINMWENRTEEELKEIKEKLSKFQHENQQNMNDEQKNKIKQKISLSVSKTYSSFSEEKKKLMYLKQQKSLNNRSEEEKIISNEKRSESCKKSWSEKSQEEKRNINLKREKYYIENFGVRHYSQTEKGKNSRNFKKYFYNNIYFDSSSELAFYMEHQKEGIQRNNSKKLGYEFKNKIYYTFPDFELKGEFYEIKGSQFLDKNNNSWINPYFPKNHKLYKEECEKYEAKHQCLIQNNVKIIYDFELKDLIQKYKKEIKSFKIN